MSGLYFPREEYERRWARTYREMERRGFDTAVVWGRSGGTYDRASDVLYLTNYYGNNSGQGLDNPLTHCRAFAAVILRIGQEPELFTEDMGPRPAFCANTRLFGTRNPVPAVAASLKERPSQGPVALVGSDFFPMKYWRELKEQTPFVTWTTADDLVQEVRKIKSAREFDLYREGGEIATRACTRLIEALLLGRTEAEAAAEAAHEVIRSGGAIHMIPSSHGETIESFVRNPLPGYSLDAPVPGELARAFVYGPMKQGYYLDPGRTVVCGRKATAAQRALIEGCAGVLEALAASIRPGMPVPEFATLGDRLLDEMGAEKDEAAEKFPIYGHGLGLFFEKPYLSNIMGDPDDVFLENMVIGIEVFTGRSGVGSAGFEQNYLITAEGAELLTKTPMFWW